MAGYTRQSVADITANAVIKAAPVNAEYNAIRDAFTHATGHKHDGSSTEGAFIPTIADVDALNKVVIDSTNNRISFFSQVGSGTVEQVRIQDGAFVPVSDSDIDLGASGAEFKDLYIDGIGYIDTVAVHENATIAGTLGVTGLSTLASVDINGGNIDATVIGAATPAAATVSSLVAATADINAGTIDGTTVGATSASTVVGTNISATNFIGPIAGAVTGNVTGNTAGVHTGAVTGNVTGNIASTGSSSFTNLTINGSLNMNAGTSGTITGLSNPVQGTDAATKTYVDAKVAAVLDSAPAALDTLNELAAALGDDANYASTTTAAIATKLPKAGGTMTGAIAMGNNKVTGLATPTAGTDVTHKTYVDAGDALQVLKAGDTMSGALAMGTNKITGVGNPTANQDVATKNYVDTTNGSNVQAANSAAASATSATNSSNSATASANSATASANSATASANSATANANSATASANSASAASSSATDAANSASGSLPKAGGAMTGAITTNSTFDGRNVSVDGSKLDSIPLVTTSSTASFIAQGSSGYPGAIQLNCEVNTHGIKLRSPPHSAGASYTFVFPNDDGASGQSLTSNGSGVTSWASMMPLSGGAMTGAITTNSTFDGRDVAADGVLATNALPKSGGAMTGAITTNSTFDGVDIATRDGVLTSTTNTVNNLSNVFDPIGASVAMAIALGG